MSTIWDLLIKNKRNLEENMNKIYNLLMGQLIVLWVFGVLGWINLMNGYNTSFEYDCLFRNCSYNDFLVWLIPLVLVFYTIGWINHRKKVDKL